MNTSNKKAEFDDYLRLDSNNCYKEAITCNKKENLLSDQSDNNSLLTHNRPISSSILLTNKHLEYVAHKACSFWKPIAREIKFNESQIMEIEKSTAYAKLDEKLYHVLSLWINKQSNQSENYFTLDNLLKLLTACRLNKIKGNHFLLVLLLSFIDSFNCF